MFIPEHLIIEEDKRRRRESRSQRIPLYAPQPQRRIERPEQRDNPANSPTTTNRGVIIIDMNDYSEVDV